MLPGDSQGSLCYLRDSQGSLCYLRDSQESLCYLRDSQASSQNIEVSTKFMGGVSI